MEAAPQADDEWAVHALNIHGTFFERAVAQVVARQQPWRGLELSRRVFFESHVTEALPGRGRGARRGGGCGLYVAARMQVAVRESRQTLADWLTDLWDEIPGLPASPTSLGTRLGFTTESLRPRSAASRRAMRRRRNHRRLAPASMQPRLGVELAC